MKNILLFIIFLYTSLLFSQNETQNHKKDSISNLHEVVVSSKIGVTQIEPQKIRFSTSDLTSQNGGTAGDILKSMPSVAMGGSPNHNRDIRLRGLSNGYTQVLINGKNSGISGNNRETVLDQIPASAIEYIEIITNPSAEYQGDGINGIVNIVLKKGYINNELKGSVTFMADNADGYNGSISLSQQKDKFGYIVSYDRLQRTINNDKFVEKNNYKNGIYDGTQLTNQLEKKSFLNENLRLNTNFKPWKEAVINAGLTYGKQLEVKNKNIDINTTKADETFKDSSIRTEPETKDNKYYEYNFDFKQSFKNNGVLKAAFSYLDFNQPKTKNINIQKLNENGTFNGNPTLQEETEMLNDDNYFGNLDYSLPIGKNNKFKTGYRLASLNRELSNSLATFNHTTGVWETGLSNEKNYSFTENTHAFYIIDEFNWKFLKINAGLRAEQTYLKLESPLDAIDVSRDYSMLLPNLTAQFTIDETQYISLGFGKRLRRPAFQDLNPFIDNRDPLIIKQGNPDLKPEYSYNYEIGYLKNFKNFNAGVNVFYRDIHDLIQKVTTEDENNILYEKPDNFTGAFLKGIELISSAKFTKWWTVNASYSYFESEISDSMFNGDALKDQVKYTAKLIMDFNLPQEFKVQVIGNLIGPKPSPQESEKELYFVDLGVSKNFLKNGTFMLRVSDIFDTIIKQKTKIATNSLTYETENTRGQIISAGVKWNF
ncbi:outer membrane beta-barrel family protein [Flavobacterium piscis]|uniref:Outer membrane receptor for ferrienterochelin and colicin n=1 Tax=Flavobacterium piscis TaxID=1114874 RepID=A0ABU1Y782_9FLAO|nr:outer membrane beta-barrel family protein [Flavobacterium piscis]MDR7210094.1 outer membrane receptor for ferrienterochelin and colicin [Flavobacterium piscis]